MIKKLQMHELWKKVVKLDRTVIILTIAIAVILAVTIYLATKPNKKLIAAANEVVSLSEEVRRYYHNRPDYWRLNTETVIREGIAPQEMIFDGKIKSALGNEVLAGSGFDGAMIMPGTRSFDVIYKNLSKKDCIALASYPYNEKQKLGLLSITIKNGENVSNFTWGGENKLPISADSAKSHCGNGSDISWSFE